MTSCNCCTTYSAPDLMDGGVAAALIEKEVAGSYTRTDEADWQARAEKATAQLHDALDEQAKLIKERDRAGEERDDWKRRAGISAATSSRLSSELVDARARAEKAEQERDEARGALRARLGMRAQPRPLTADDITDEARKRAADAWWTWKANGAASISGLVDAMLAAALTEPPTRHEGAEDIEAMVEESLSGDALSDAQVRALADFLAERGVRVTGAAS